MDKSAVLRISNRKNIILVRPTGTFKGFGAYVGINPLRALGLDSHPADIGDIVISLLDSSGPTGYHIDDHAQYLEATEDRVTISLARKYTQLRLATRELAKIFICVVVEWNTREKSWKISLEEYNSTKNCLYPTATKRINLSAGPELLGLAILHYAELHPDD